MIKISYKPNLRLVLRCIIKLTSAGRSTACPDTTDLTLPSFIPYQFISHTTGVSSLGTCCASTHSDIAISWSSQFRTNINCNELIKSNNNSFSDFQSMVVARCSSHTENTDGFYSTPGAIWQTGTFIIALGRVARGTGVGSNWTNSPAGNTNISVDGWGQHWTLNDS